MSMIDDKRKEQQKRYAQSEKGKAKRREWAQQWRAKHRQQSREYAKKYRQQNLARVREQKQQSGQKLRLQVLTHYSQGTLKCARCGFADLRALCIDHIDGHAYMWRKAHTGGASGSRLYQWLKGHEYPQGFQVLCLNCNLIKRAERGENKKLGRCHQETE